MSRIEIPIEPIVHRDCVTTSGDPRTIANRGPTGKIDQWARSDPHIRGSPARVTERLIRKAPHRKQDVAEKQDKMQDGWRWRMTNVQGTRRGSGLDLTAP